MMKLENVAIGKLFMYDGAMFVVLPFDEEEYAYSNICVASEKDSYERGDKYVFDESVDVIVVNELKLKEMLTYY